MPLFRRKPTEIEAWQWNGEKTGQMHGVCQCSANSQPHLHTAHDNSFGEGQMVFLFEGDWIIPERKAGRFYPCKPDVFAATYEVIGEKPAFEAIDGHGRHVYKIWVDGRTEGFGGAAHITNRIPQLIQKATADALASAVEGLG